MPFYVLTGASRGIGLEFVRQLVLDSGNLVFALVRNISTATQLAELRARAPNLRVLQADVNNAQALKTASSEVAEFTNGILDCLICNAAAIGEERRSYTLSEYSDDSETLEKDIQNGINVNVVGVVHTINAFLPLLHTSSVKKVIALSSALGGLDATLISGFPLSAPYSISKAALNMVIAKYAVEYRHQGFVFLAVSPGLVMTAQQSPSATDVRFFETMVAGMRKVFPDWDGQPLSVEESVRLLLEMIDKANVKVSGRFISQFGDKTALDL